MNYSLPRSVAFRDLPQEDCSLSPAAMAQLWSRTRMLNQVLRVVKQVSGWSGVLIAPDGLGLGFTLGGVMLGHLRWDGRLNLPFEPDVSESLLEEEMVQRDPNHLDSSRVIFDVRNILDADHAVWLLRLAYLSADMGGLPPKPLTCRI